MSNRKGNPDNLKKFVSNRDEPLTEKIGLRVTASMMNKLKTLDDIPEFIREAIAKALEELESRDNQS